MTTAILFLAGSMAVSAGCLIGAISGRIRNRHQHGPWIIVGSRYVPPDSTITELTVPAHRIAGVSDLLYGYTTLTERCGSADCRMVRTRRVSGELADDVSGVTIR